MRKIDEPVEAQVLTDADVGAPRAEEGAGQQGLSADEGLPGFDPARSWYHGSQLELTTIRRGSTITQKRELARVFSHKPPLVCVSDEGQIKHTGTLPGCLYVIAEEVGEGDVMPHPRTTMGPGDEWLTRRELRVRLLGRTEIVEGERFTDEELAAVQEYTVVRGTRV